MKPVIITAALVGGELSRKDTPYLPISPKEIGAEAVRVVQAGASVLHIHARDEKGTPRHDPKIFAEIQKEIRQQSKEADVDFPIVQFSTGGSVGMSVEERMAPLSLRPEMATLTTGTINFGANIFENSFETIVAIAKRLKDERIAVELEIFDSGMIDNALSLFRKGLLNSPLRFNFVLGVPGGLGGEPENLIFLWKKIPSGALWGVAGIGRHQLPLATLALVLGGNVRCGLEDNIYIRKGELAKGNAPLVDRVVRIAREVDREVASPSEAREILQLGG